MVSQSLQLQVGDFEATFLSDPNHEPLIEVKLLYVGQVSLLELFKFHPYNFSKQFIT